MLGSQVPCRTSLQVGATCTLATRSAGNWEHPLPISSYRRSCPYSEVLSDSKIKTLLRLRASDGEAILRVLSLPAWQIFHIWPRYQGEPCWPARTVLRSGSFVDPSKPPMPSRLRSTGRIFGPPIEPVPLTNEGDTVPRSLFAYFAQPGP